MKSRIAHCRFDRRHEMFDIESITFYFLTIRLWASYRDFSSIVNLEYIKELKRVNNRRRCSHGQETAAHIFTVDVVLRFIKEKKRRLSVNGCFSHERYRPRLENKIWNSKFCSRFNQLVYSRGQQFYYDKWFWNKKIWGRTLEIIMFAHI